MTLLEIRQSFVIADGKALGYIYHKHQKVCIGRLIKKTRCEPEVARDFFIDAIIIFRDKVLNDTFKELTNLEAYLYRICENRFLTKLKIEKSRDKKLSDIEFLYYSNDLINDNDELDNKLAEATKKAWELLSEKCKDIIYYFYVDKLKMSDIANLTGLGSAEVAKSTKARCYKKMLANAKEYYTI